MKKLLLLVIVNFCFVLNAQTIIKGNYAFNKNGSDYEIKSQKLEESEDIKSGYIVVVDSIDLSKVYYKYAEFKKDSIKNKKLNNKIFSMSIDDFKKMTDPYYPKIKGFSIGGLSIPIRMRGKGENFTFENDLSLGVNLLLGWGKNTSPNSWIDGSLGFSITKINLTKDNSNVPESRSATALTFSSGLIIKLDQLFKNPYINKNPINIGFFAGFDSLGATDLKANWKYNKQIWLGIGLNIGISPVASNKGTPSNVVIK